MVDENPNFYDNKEECERRLLNTVVMYDGEPCYVKNVRDGYNDGLIRLFVKMLPIDRIDQPEAVRAPVADDVPNAEGLIRKRVDAKKFNNFRPFLLGYCNHFEGGYRTAGYLSRTPVRRGKQGLCSESLLNTFYLDRGRGPSFATLVSGRAFYETVMGIYPEYQAALDGVKRSPVEASIAVDRSYCLFRDELGFIFLHRCNERIGIIINGVIHLSSRSIQYREEIIACNNLPNEVRNYV